MTDTLRDVFGDDLSEWGLLVNGSIPPRGQAWAGVTFAQFHCHECEGVVPLRFGDVMECAECGAKYESRVMIRRTREAD